MANDAELTGLIVKIKADITEYQTKLNQMQTQTATASASVASKFDAMGATMAKAGIAMGAFAATAVNSAMAWGSAVNKLAKQTGMSAEETSKFLVIAKKTGVDTDTASMMFAKLAKSINSATKEQTAANAEGKTSGDIFTQLGVKTIDANGHMRKTGDIFVDIKNKLSGMETGWQKTAIQMEIFGRTGYQLNGLLNMTAADMKDAIDMAQSLGLILDDKTAPAWAKLSKEITAAKGVLSSTGITIGNELMPMFKEIINSITAATKAFTSMNPEVRSAAIQVATLYGEIGIAVTVLNRVLGSIGAVTEALGIMKMATWTAAGPWIALAGAIAYAITKLNEYQTRDRSWRGNKEAIDNPFTPGDIKERLEYKGMGDFDKRADEESLNKIISSQPKETPPPDLFIGGGSGSGGSGAKGAKEKTELQKYLEQLKDVEDILNRQSDLGEINKDQVKTSLEAQLEGLKKVLVGQDEQLDKERAIYDLKTKLRQVERDQIDIAKAKSDRDYAAQTITEAQYFEERKKEIQGQINLEVEGSAKRYNAEKELQDLINANSDKQLTRSLSKISSDQTLASNNLKIESEQLRHKQAMSKIGNLDGDTAASLKSAIDAEKAIVNAQYAIDLKAVNDEIDLYTKAGEKKTEELKKAIIERRKLQQNYNNAILVMDDSLAEKQKQLEQNKIDANNATISALITRTKSGHDILKDMWFQFVDQIVAKMFSINTESNIFTQLLGGLFGGSTSSVATTASKGLTSLQKSVLPSTGFSIDGARAGGGPVEAGKTYLVGEKRPELFTPNTDGIIIPDLSMARSGSNSNNASGGNSQMVSVSISQTFQSLDPAENMRLVKAQNASLKSEILNSIKTETAWRSAVKGAAK